MSLKTNNKQLLKMQRLANSIQVGGNKHKNGSAHTHCYG